MGSRCWWATWVSGFFGIAGLLHLARLLVPVRVVVGTFEMPIFLTVVVGMASLGLSAGFLALEVQRERAQQSDRLTHHLVRHYDRLAPHYDSRWEAYLKQTATRTLEALRLSGTERILDIGCGTADWTRMALERFPNLTIAGIDASSGMVAAARQKLAAWPQVSVGVAHAEALPFSQETFDIVICTNMLHHVRDPQAVLRECERVLRAPGTLLVVDWCRDFWHCRVMHYWLRLFDGTYATMYGLAELTRMLEERGFSIDQADRFLAKPWYGMLLVAARRLSDEADARHRTS